MTLSKRMRKKTKLFILILFFVIGGVSYFNRMNYLKKIDYRKIDFIEVEHDYPPFDSIIMDEKDVELFVKHFNETKFTECEHNEVNALIGEGTRFTISLGNDKFIVYSLKPYFQIDSIWYTCNLDSELYTIISKYE